MVKLFLEYIQVKRSERKYKVYLKDIKSIHMSAKKERPPVPMFEEKPFLETE